MRNQDHMFLNKRLLRMLSSKSIITKKTEIKYLNNKSLSQRKLIYQLIHHEKTNPETIGKIIADNLGLEFSNHLDRVDLESTEEEHYLILAKEEAIVFCQEDDSNIIFSCYSLDQVEKIVALGKINQKKISIIIISEKTSSKYLSTFFNKFIIKEITSGKNIHVDEIIKYILTYAFIFQASDIHIQKERSKILVRCRIDGELKIINKLPIIFFNKIVVKIKILANLNINQSDISQDGRFRYESIFFQKRDCRTSICPGVFSEKIVIRLLDHKKNINNLSELFLNKKHEFYIRRCLEKPQGLILITGPTGSGKTQTLYTLINQLDQYKNNITTIENPVEMIIPGIHQININPESSFLFFDALRATLRQDPDIILIGEIRDKKTASLAIHAAQTGHLVFSTLHSNNTIDSITRLINLGIEPFNLSDSLLMIMAQRLIRKRCPTCQNNNLQLPNNKKYNLPSEVKLLTECFECLNGFSGRLPIVEILYVDQSIKQMLLKNNPMIEINDYFKHHKIQTLWDNAKEKLDSSLTTLLEIKTKIGED